MIKLAALTISSPEIGMGHLVRTTQLLSTLDSDKFSFKIYGELKSIPHWIDKFDYEIIQYDLFDYEVLNKYDLIIFDNYVNRDVLNKINKKKLLIDDLNFLGDSDVDVVLDYNYGSSLNLYPEDQILLSGPEYFPISKKSYPEFLDPNNRDSFDINGKILLSFGGVSDQNLINIENEINFFSNYGDVVLMDPMSKLSKYEGEVDLLINEQTLSEVFSTYQFKFCKLAGGTSKYIALAYLVPLLYVHRNNIEKTLIDSLYLDGLVLKQENLSLLRRESKLDNVLSTISQSYAEKFKFDGETLLNKELNFIL